MWRWILTIALALMGLQLPVAQAADRVEIQTNIPFKEILNINGWSRIYVDLDNNGDEFQGELKLVLVDHKSKAHPLPYMKEIKLKKDENKQVYFDVPNQFSTRYYDESSSLQLGLYENDELIQKTKVTDNSRRLHEGDISVVVLDKNPNSMSFLNQARQTTEGASNMEEYKKSYSMADSAYWEAMQVRNIDPKQLPSVTHVLHNIQILIIGDIPAGSLTDEQVGAVKNWVLSGGKLILSASTPEELLNQFKDIAPAYQKNPGMTNDLAQLEIISKGTKLPFTELNMYDKNLPLFSIKENGTGKVLFANFDVNAQPLVVWAYNQALWNRIIFEHGLHQNMVNKYGMYDTPVDMIPGVSLPSPFILLMIWLGYVVMLGPVMYMVLKRRDKREWAWGIIPLTSILFCVGTLTFGKNMIASEDKIYTVTNIKVINKDVADVSTNAAVLIRSGGKMSVDTGEQFLPPTMNIERKYEIRDQEIVQDETGKTRVTHNKVPYMTQTSLETFGLVNGIGELQADVTYKQKKLKGTIKNNTKFSFEELYLQMGTNQIKIGPLGKGESTTIDVEVKPVFNQQQIFDRERGKMTREEIAKQRYESMLMSHSGSGKIMLVGSSTDSYPVYNLADHEVEEHFLTVISQPIRIKNEANNKVTYPYGTIEVGVTFDEKVHEEVGQIVMYNGKATFSLPVPSDFKAERVESPLDNIAFEPVKKYIYHAKSREWKELPSGKALVLQGNVEEYVNQLGEILVRFVYTGDEPVYVPKPVFEMEGRGTNQ
ncbi:hypothetical protein [Brevibacillus daliensis]|uniref:hypothetical protein n=1 Tax=Brevibacillus daliensis TaxID=2892995 RepID=UPI001E38D1E1|nr:hypothetical protein [Brevibacillus daliensis]